MGYYYYDYFVFVITVHLKIRQRGLHLEASSPPREEGHVGTAEGDGDLNRPEALLQSLGGRLLHPRSCHRGQEQDLLHDPGGRVVCTHLHPTYTR